MNTIILEFDKDDLKLQIRRAAPRYWYNAADLAYICAVGQSVAAELFWDYMNDGDLDLFGAEKTRLLNREELRFDMCMIAECMILDGEY